MDRTPDEPPLLIAVYDLFIDHRPRTLQSVVDTLNVSEEAAMSALERLEDLNVLVRTRGGTDVPVWKRHVDASKSLFEVGEMNRQSA